MSNRAIELEELRELGVALLSPNSLVGLALLVACLGLSWVVVSLLQRRIHHQQQSVFFGQRIVDGVLFPILALLLALLAKAVLPMLGISHAVFKVAVPVLVSLLIIRLTVQVLRTALPKSALIELIEQTVSWAAWVGSILWVIGVLPWLRDELNDITFKLGATKISVTNLIEASMTALIVIVLALWLASVIESRLLRGTGVDLSLRKIAANVTRAVLLLAAILFSLSAAGMDLTALGVMGGAVGVGIGLGLQKLASNYVSGFVILAERSLRIGDMVKVDNFEGRITDIKTRFTVIRALNGRESIVPNELLMTQRVENSSLADPTVSISTVVQVAYGTDLDALLPVLTDAVRHIPRVLKSPEPSVLLTQFAADGLELTVSFWIADPENGQAGVRSEVNLCLLRKLTELGIEIPFPQRVMHPAVLALAPTADATPAAPLADSGAAA